MASSESSSNLRDNHDEIIELEITEIDKVLLRNLLEEAMNEETRGDGIIYAACTFDVKNESNAKITEQELEQCGLQLSDLDWHDLIGIEAPTFVMDENSIVWYIDEMVGMVDFTCNGEYSELTRGVFYDETTYCCLWHE